jgi:lipopolysaccharide export system permease protein
MKTAISYPLQERLQKYTINIDLSQLNKVDINDQNIANTNTMLTVNELKYTLDSLDKILKQKLFLFGKTSISGLVLHAIAIPKKQLNKVNKKLPDDILSLYTRQKSEILK